jgi:lipopolysaccharide export system permease protein
MRRIARYALSEFALSFLVAFSFFFFIFFINQLLVMAEEIFAKQVPFWDVLLFILFSLPSIVALSFPFGALVGALMSVGRLSSDNELLAMRASGIPLRKVLAPLLAMGLILSLISFVMNDYFLPLGNLRLGRMYRKILYSNPGIELEAYSVKKYQDMVIITGGIEGNRIGNLVILDKNDRGQKRVITARRAVLEEASGQRGVISIRLEEVFSQARAVDGRDRYEYTTADSMIYNILLKDISVAFMNPGPREMRSVDVWRQIQSMEKDFAATRREHAREVERLLVELTMQARYLRDGSAGNAAAVSRGLAEVAGAYSRFVAARDRHLVDRNLQLYLLEFHKKFSIPFACLIFVLFAFPIALLARRSGRAVGFGIGLLVSTVYWGLLFTGQTLGMRVELPPPLAMWLPNLLVLAAAISLLASRIRG